MNDSDYNPQQDPWYSPHQIIDYFEQIRLQYGDPVQTDHLFKKAREMFSASVALFGAYELSPENQYYLQINRQGSTPDVMTAQRTVLNDGTVQLGMIQIEIVDMEAHANTDDVVDFLLQTKLSPHKSYSDKTLIVCFINRRIPIQHRIIHERLKQLSPKPTIYICGRILNAPPGSFMIFSAFPILTKPLEFNINDTAKKYSLKPRLTAHLGIGDTLVPTGIEYVNVYEVLGLNQQKINQKYAKVIIK